MNWKGCGRKRSWPNLIYYPGIYLQELRKPTKDLSQGNRSPGRDLNAGPLKYEAAVLTTRPRCSVKMPMHSLRNTEGNTNFKRITSDRTGFHTNGVQILNVKS
jgi:hypothetical protein